MWLKNWPRYVHICHYAHVYISPSTLIFENFRGGGAPPTPPSKSPSGVCEYCAIVWWAVCMFVILKVSLFVIFIRGSKVLTSINRYLVTNSFCVHRTTLDYTGLHWKPVDWRRHHSTWSNWRDHTLLLGRGRRNNSWTSRVSNFIIIIITKT